MDPEFTGDKRPSRFTEAHDALIDAATRSGVSRLVLHPRRSMPAEQHPTERRRWSSRPPSGRRSPAYTAGAMVYVDPVSHLALLMALSGDRYRVSGASHGGYAGAPWQLP